jgi:uncharacterized protein YdeI (YjbR/CyaY-like superfamily)
VDEQLLFENRMEYRVWLEQNQDESKGVWLVFSKSESIKSLKSDEALEEALCFGWIDGQIKSIDDTKYIKKFTPRKKGSKWSEKNHRTALRLIEEGKMTERGLSAIEQAKKEGTWDVPKPEPLSDEQIEVLVNAISSIEPAYSNFIKMSRSIRSTYAAHYLSAKSEDTRERRLMQIAERLNENKKPM